MKQETQFGVVKVLGLLVCFTLIAFQLYLGVGVHPEITAIHLVVAIALFLVSIKSRRIALLLLISAILLFGWVSTWIPSPDLELRPMLVAAVVMGVLLFNRGDKEIPNYVSYHLSLLIFSIITLISLASTIFYVTSFRPVPGWEYINIAVNVLSVSANNFIFKSLNMAGVYAMWWGVFFLAVNQKWDNRFRRQIVILFIALLAANLLLALFQSGGFTALSGNLLEGDRVRAHGFMQSPHALNNVSAVLITFLLIMLNKEQNKRLLLPLGFLAFAAIMVGGGFSAMVYCLVSLTASGLILFFKGGPQVLKRERLKKAGLYAGIAAVIVCVFLGVLYSTDMGSEVLDRIVRLSDPGGKDFAMQRFFRESSWGLGSKIALEFPLSGVGVGTFPLNSLNYSAMHSAPFFIIDNSLNFFVEIAVCLGIPALILILFLFSKIIFGVLGSNKLKSKTVKSSLVVPVITFCLFGFSGPHLNDIETALIFWLMLAGVVKRYCNENREGFERKLYLGLIPAFVAISLIGSWLFNEQFSLNEVNKEVRWHIGLGNYPREESGEFWTSAKSILSFVPKSHYLHVRWRTNADGAEYQPEVKMFINGKQVFSEISKDSNWQDSYFFLEKVQTGYSYLAIEVSETYVPAENVDSSDQRDLGIRIGSLEVINQLPEMYFGFWAWEQGEEEEFSWTREEALINLPEQKDKLEFSLRTGRPDVTKNYVKVKMYLYGREIFKTVLKNSKWQRFSLNLQEIIENLDLSPDTRDFLNGRGIIRIKVEGSWSPAEFGSQDSRMLGVAFMPYWDRGGER
jgi:hypothetical protein